MIRNVFIDLDDTILDFHMAEKTAISKTLTHLGVEPAEKTLHRYSELNLAQWKLLEQGKLTRQQVKTRRFELLFEELGVKHLSVQETVCIYEDFLSRGHYFMDGAEELLHTLYGSFRLYLASNGSSEVQKGRIESAGIERFFSGIFISENIGFNKPDKRFFDFCFSQIQDFRKEETIIIGDSLSSDIKGGKNAGIRTVWFNPSHHPNDTGIFPDDETDSLLKLPALIACL